MSAKKGCTRLQPNLPVCFYELGITHGDETLPDHQSATYLAILNRQRSYF
jgi:hypothetical protein